MRKFVRSTAYLNSQIIALSLCYSHPSTPTTMASTSSFNRNASNGKFDVFINHRGIDVKNSFASIIYHTLTLDCIGLRVFMDREELEVGEKISDTIKEAISDAVVHIAIFSPNYAQSRWCLDELTLMLQTGKKFIPIFYHVEPFHLRCVAHGRGVYSEAFSKHEKDGRYQPEKLQEWKKALSTASEISGLELNERQNDQGLLLKKIVNNVIAEMRNVQLLDVGRHSVGLDTAIDKFENFVKSVCSQSKQNVKVVGIVGMGGCGKTTLVKEYFNKKRSSYQSSSFLFDVKDAAAKNTLHDLQKKLLEDLHLGSLTFHHTSQGKRTLEDRVRSVTALIILDDVDHLDQMDALLPLKDNLRADSLIVVTTRDKGLIESSASLSSSVSPFVYKIGGLDPVHGRQLFCWHAFLRDYPLKGFEDLVEKFLNACQGLPLSIKVIGAQLCGNNNRDYWEFVLHKISKILPKDIKQRLQVSYDALDEEQQQMFLDIACFFIAEQKDMAISIWDGSGWDGFLWSGWHGFQILESKCLVEVDHDNCIRMHDHLRDLGREIAIKKIPSRFWSHSQFVNSQRPLEERLPVRGLMAATGSIVEGNCNLYYEPPFEECMQLLMGYLTSRSRRLTPSAHGLQLLVVRGDYFKEQFAKLSEELVWLRWYDFPHGKLPSWLSTGKLRVLELYGAERLTELWGPNDHPPLQLRELIIDMTDTSCNLQMIPETIGVLKHLKKIVLEGDAKHNQISSLPEEFCLVESLEQLELLNFSHLSSLPTDFGNLRKLKYINLRGCQTLTALPVSFDQLTELQYLDLSGCENLQLGKDILENITKLEKLRLGGCSKLQQLPNEITRQTYLRELCLSPTGLRELPAEINRLTKLEVLEIGSDCLTSLPTSLGNLSSLIKLKIEGCGELTHLPSVGYLTRLENLKLESSGVKYLPEGFGQLVNLQNLEIYDCPIRELPLSNPEKLYSKKPTLWNHVDSSIIKPKMLPRLKSIHLWYTQVSTISISEDCCPSLEYLDLSGNHDLMEIETLPTTLKRVQISACEKLESIRGVAGLGELQNLEIWDCPLRELPLANPEEHYSKKPTLLKHVDSSIIKPEMHPRLKSVHLCGTKVSTISISKDCCPSLEYLYLCRNDDLMEIKTLPTTLKGVQIWTCEKLENIRGVAGLAELQNLGIYDCPIRELPLANPEEPNSKKPTLFNYVDSSMFKFPRLKRIDLKGTKVSTISISEDCCPSLEDLDLSKNHDLMEIETLPTTLKRVQISSCKKLENVRGIAGLAELQHLQILHCPIRELPLANPEEPYSKKPTLLNHVDSSMIKPEMLPMPKSIHLCDTKVSTIWISEDCCPGVIDLNVFHNKDLVEIETLPTTLKRVKISSCGKLKNIRGVAGLAALQDLTIRNCPGLDELPSFSGLVELQRLWIEKCPQLHKLPSFAGLVELRDFWIEECPEIDELPSFECCTCLEELKIEVSSRVTKIEGLEELISLKTLRLQTYWEVPGIKGLKNLDKLTTLQIRAESISAIATCIPPNILRRACRMDIVGRAVEDVESVVGSLSFPNFTVVDTLHHSSEWVWQMKSHMSNASCVIVCFVISCRSQEGGILCDVGSARFDSWDTSSFGWLVGKQVYISVWPEGFQLNDDSRKGSERVFLTLCSRDVQIEKGMAVIMEKGEEEKALAPLHKFLEFLGKSRKTKIRRAHKSGGHFFLPRFVGKLKK